VAKLFFLLSGENETLPSAELLAILEAENINFSILEKLDQVIRIESELKCIELVNLRSAYTRVCSLELDTSIADHTTIIEAVKNVEFEKFIKEKETFSVRIKRIKNYAKKSTVMILEREIGEIILKKTKNTKVNLSRPDKIFFGILTSGKFIFGLKIATIWPKPFGDRRPRKKPFFHPSGMPSKLARSMVNLARAKRNDLLVDPFCGTGSTLIEATYIGCRTLGLDAQIKMLDGCKKNLNHYNITPEGLILADARKPPIINVDCAVTDPPYGRCCSTMKSTTKKIVKEVLNSFRCILEKGGKICIASPKKINLALIGQPIGYKHLESHFVYVHGTLTREIAVFEKSE
jgi:tRNA (guanine10-N2)-dimethyltransferase